jgi:hypothetical protein
MGAPTGFLSLTEEEEQAAHLRRYDLHARHQQRGGPPPPPPPGPRMPGPPPPPGVYGGGPYPLSGLQRPGAIRTMHNAPDDDEFVERAIPPLTDEQLLLASPLVKGFSMKTKRWGKSYSVTI